MFNLATAPFSPNSDWNTPVGTNATYSQLNWPASDGYNYSVNWATYSPAVYVASASDPLVQVSVPDSWGYPGGTVGVHMPTAANGAAGTDGELVVVDGDAAYNFWQFNRTSATTATASAYGQSNVVTGTGWGSQSPFLGAVRRRPEPASSAVFWFRPRPTPARSTTRFSSMSIRTW